jgi:hypothetical protein
MNQIRCQCMKFMFHLKDTRLLIEIGLGCQISWPVGGGELNTLAEEKIRPVPIHWGWMDLSVGCDKLCSWRESNSDLWARSLSL